MRKYEVRRWVRATGLVAGLIVCAAAAHAPPARAQPAPAPTGSAGKKPKPQYAKGGGQATSVVAATWSYLKMHQPGTIVDALRQRQAGKVPAAALDGLAGSTAMTELLKPAWASVVDREPAAKNGSTGRPHTWHEVAASQASVMSLAALADVTPNKLDFSVFGAGGQTRSAWGEAPQDGKVTATISGSKAFHVVRIVDYDGTTSGGGGSASLKEWDSRAAPPFEMAMQAGQQFQVQVAFDATLGEKAGASKATLDIQGAGWSAHVPLEGTIVGLNGTLGFDPSPPVLIIADPTDPRPVQFSYPLIFKNDSQAFKGVLTAASLPLGVTMSQSNVTFDIGAHETKRVDVPLTALPLVPHGWQNVTLTLKVPGGTSPVGFAFDALMPIATWSYSASNLAGGASVAMSLTLTASGFNYYGAGFSIGFPDFFDGTSSSAEIQAYIWSSGGGGFSNAQWRPTGGANGWNAYLQSSPTFAYNYTWVDPAYLFL
jgi:hypothetical protein